jgi:hypothetical protein
MDRKTIYTLVICAGIVFFWQRFVMIPQPPKDEAVQVQDTASLAKPDPSMGVPAGSDKPAEAHADKPNGDKPAATGDTPPARRPENLSHIDMPGRYHAELSSWGGRAQRSHAARSSLQGAHPRRGCADRLGRIEARAIAVCHQLPRLGLSAPHGR